MEPRSSIVTSGSLIRPPTASSVILQPLADPYQQLQNLYGANPMDMAARYAQSWQPPPVEEDPWDVDVGRIILSGLKGYASGFLALNIGGDEIPTNHLERIASQVGHLAGFIGLGFPVFGGMLARGGMQLASKGVLSRGASSFLMSAANFRGIPMLAADKALKTVSQGQAFKYLTEGAFRGNLVARQVAQQSVHLGVASAVVEWQQGLHGALTAGFHGMLFGGLSAGMGNLPIMRERTTAAALLRAGSGAALNLGMMGPAAFTDEVHWTDKVYNAALGAYFGAIQPTAAQQRAQEFLYRELPADARTGSGGFKLDVVYGESSNLWSLPKEVQQEVRLLTGDLHAPKQMASAMYHILTRLGGKEPKVELTKLADYDIDTPNLVRELLDMEAEFPSTQPSSQRLQTFARNVREKGASDQPWRDVEMMRLVDSIGEKHRAMEDSTYEAFKSDVQASFERAGIHFTEWKPNTLAAYYNVKKSTSRIAIVGRDRDGFMVPLSELGLDFKKNALGDAAPLTPLHWIGRSLRLESDPETVAFLVKGQEGKYRGQQDNLSRDPQDVAAAMMDPLAFYNGRETFRVPKQGGGYATFRLVDSRGNSRYYPIHGAGNKDAVVMARYNLQRGKSVGQQLNDIVGEAARATGLKESEISKAIERAFQNDPVTDRQEFNRRLVSNVNWYKSVFLQGSRDARPWNVSLEAMGKGNFIGDLANFNKRLQPLFTNYHPVARDFVPNIRYVISPDLERYAEKQLGQKFSRMDKEVSDGATLITRELYDKIAGYLEFENPQEGSSLKPFVMNGDADLGLLIGKTAFHVASEPLQRAMRRSGIDMIMYESAAKQFGNRTSLAHRIGKDGQLEFAELKENKKTRQWDVVSEWQNRRTRRDAGLEDHVYEMSGDDVYMNMASPDKMGQGAELVKQAMSMMVPELIGRDAQGRYSRSLARRNYEDIDTEVLYRAIQSTPEARRALHRINEEYGDEAVGLLFSRSDRTGRILAEEADPIALLEAVSKPGREKAYGEFIKMLLRSDEAGELIKADPDDAQTFWMDQGEMEGSDYNSVFETRGAGDVILRQALGELGPMLHKAAYSRLDTLISNWLVNRLSRPYIDSAIKSVMKPYDMGDALDIGYDDGSLHVKTMGGREAVNPEVKRFLKQGTYFLEQSALRTKVRFLNEEGVEEMRTISSLRGMVAADPENQDLRTRVREALSVTSIRTPMTDASGARELAIGGFKKGKGWGTLLHGKDMAYEGGADLDIDTTTLYWGLPRSLRDVYARAQNERPKWESALKEFQKFGGMSKDFHRNAVRAFLRKPDDIPSLRERPKDEEQLREWKADQIVGMFDSYQRVRLGMEVARGRGEMAGSAVSTRTLMHYLYSAANAERRRTLEVNIGDGYRIEYEARGDNGTLFRALSDAAVSSSVDVARYGSMVSRDEMRAILTHAAFKRVSVVRDGERTVLFDDSMMSFNGDEVLPSQEAIDFVKNDIRTEDGRRYGMYRALKSEIETPMAAMQRVNRALYGRNWEAGRAWYLHERLPMAKDWPTANGLPIMGYVGTIAQRLAQVKSTYVVRPLVDHVMENPDRFFNAMGNFQQGFKKKGREFWAWMGIGGAKEPMPQISNRHLSNLMKRLTEAGADAILGPGEDIRSFESRRRFARDPKAWARFVEVMQGGKNPFVKDEGFFKTPDKFDSWRPENQEEWRARKVDTIYRRINDFISNDFDDVAALWTMRDQYIKTGLRPAEARALLDRAQKIKAEAAEVYKERTREDRDTPDYREKSASSVAEGYARQEYLDYVAGGGLRAFVEELNMRPERLSGQERKLRYADVLDFFDSTMLSPWHIKQGKTSRDTRWESKSRNFGFQVASDHVVAQFAQRYAELYRQTTQGRPAAAPTLRDLLQGTPRISGSLERTTSRDYMRTQWAKLPKESIDPEIMSYVDRIAEEAGHFDAFRKNPEKLVEWILGDKAQPSDLTIPDLKAAYTRLKRYRKGYGFFRMFLNARYGESEAAMRFNPVMASVFFPKTTADMMMLHDLQVIDREFSAEPVPRVTYVRTEDGRIRAETVYKKAAIPMTTMHRLININGEQLQRLEESGEAEINRIMDENISWMRAPIKHAASGRDLGPKITSYAVERMQLDAYARDRKSDDYATRSRAERFLEPQRIRTRRAYFEVMKELGIEFKKTGGRRMNNEMFTYIDENGRPQTEDFFTVSRKMASSMESAFKRVAEEKIQARTWIEKNLSRILTTDNNDLSVEQIKARFSDVLEYGVASEGHIPLDLARLIYYESELGRYAEARLAKHPKEPFDRALLLRGGKYADLLRQFDLQNTFELRTAEGVRALAERLGELSRSDAIDSDVVAERLARASEYYFQPFGERDMRRFWQRTQMGHTKDGYSRYMDDVALSTGRMTDIQHEKNILRSESPIYETPLENGYWPHLDFDLAAMGKHIESRMKWVAKRKDLNKEQREKKLRGLRDLYDRAAGRVHDPDAHALDAHAAAIMEENPQSFLDSFRHAWSLAQRTENLDGYRTDLGVLPLYAKKVVTATYGNMSNMLSRDLIRDFEARKPMGEYTGAWSKWMRIYVRDTMGKPSIFPQEYFDDEYLNLKRTPYYWLSDHWMATKGGTLNRALLRLSKVHEVTDADRAYFRLTEGREMTPKEERDYASARLDELTKIEGDALTADQANVLADRYRGMSELEAKYEMMSLLFHSKTVATNLFGGTVNSIISSGWRNFADAGKVETWRELDPSRFQDMDDVKRWVAEMGVVENWIVNEFVKIPRYRNDEAFRRAVDRGVAALRKDPFTSDQTLMGIFREAGLSDRLANLAAMPMRKSERWLRTRAFLAGLLQARQNMTPVQLPIDHPHLIEMGRKAVATSQFLYDAANRPPFARTSLGKIFSRFRIWSWSSVKMRREVFQASRDYGHMIGSPENERLRRMIQADMFAVGLASFFPFTIFETAGLPAPYNWLKDLSDYFFGDDFERETAFFGSPLGPFNEVMPVVFGKTISAGDEIFSSLIGSEKEALSMYPIAAMFPFGRMANDVYRSLQQPQNMPKYLLGIPLQDFGNYRRSIEQANTFVTTSSILMRTVINGATRKEVEAAYEAEGYSATEARQALNTAEKHNLISKEIDPTTGAYRYYSIAEEDELEDLVRESRRRLDSSAPLGIFLR